MSDPLRSPAEALVAIIERLGFRGELWEPQTIRLPAGTVGTPTLRRRAPDDRESQLLTNDWWVEFTVSLYFDLRDAQKAQQGMVDGLLAFTRAIDADPSLALTVLDAAVTSAVPFVEKDRNRPLVGYEITVATLSLVNPDAL